MSATKKIYPSAVLKHLPEERQQAIVDYCDGDGGGGRPHSIVQTVAWLREDGIVTSGSALSEFRSWFLLRQQLKLNEQAALEMVLELREKGLVKTAAEEQEAGQVFFTRLAIQQQDAKVWFLTQQLALQKEKLGQGAMELELAREKFQFDAAEACLKKLPELKLIGLDNALDRNGKIDAIRRKLFGEVAE